MRLRAPGLGRADVVFPPFAQRDSVSLEALLPGRRASLVSSGECALNLMLFQLGVATFVDGEAVVELQLIGRAKKRGAPDHERV